MSKQFDNTNKGVLFINEDRETPKHPHFKGSFTDSDDNEFWVAGWKKVSKDGVKYISLSFTPKETNDTESEADEEDDFFEEKKKPTKKKQGSKKPSKGKSSNVDDLPF